MNAANPFHSYFLLQTKSEDEKKSSIKEGQT